MGGISVCKKRTGVEYDLRKIWESKTDESWVWLVNDTYIHYAAPFSVLEML